jgi:hypothetical protein
MIVSAKEMGKTVVLGKEMAIKKDNMPVHLLVSCRYHQE